MKPRTDTITAIASAPGKGAVGIVRVSGSDITELVMGILGRIPFPRSATLAKFLDGDGAPIDQGIAVFFPGPHSYTGEPVLELQGHGGSVVLARILRRCIELGARAADPGEFTQRAFLNDKIDLAQAESVADLIDAATERAAKCAIRSLQGEFSVAIDEFVMKLDDLRTLVEATLDFPEEEVDFIHAANVSARLLNIGRALTRTLSAARRGSVLREGIQVVLVGRPNVGKSTLMNRLAGEDIAIVTEVPGTTRDPIRQMLQIRGVPLRVIDTAGLRTSDDPVERIGIARTRAAIESADMVVVIRAAEGCDGMEEDLPEELPDRLPRIEVINKIDLVGHPPGIRLGDRGAEVKLSALTGQGVEFLEDALLTTVGWVGDEGEGIYMARARHLEALELAEKHVAAAASESGRLELMAEHLREARTALTFITGEHTPDDLLRNIFSRFCIGK